MPLEIYNKSQSTWDRFTSQQVGMFAVNEGSPAPPPTQTVIWKPHTASVQGYKNPDWRRAVRVHKEATTPFIGDRSKLTARPGHHYIEFSSKWSGVNGGRQTRHGYGRYGDFLLGAHTSAGTTTGISTAAVNARAKMQFMKAALAENRAFQGMVTAGELPKTLQMLRNPLKALRLRTMDYYRTLRKGEALSRRADRQKHISRAYLEWTYGATPLFGEIAGAYEALKRVGAKEVQTYKRIRSTYSETSDVTLNAWSSMSSGYGSQLYYRTRSSSEVMVTYYGEMRRRVKDGRFARSSQFGFRPHEFVPTLWELLPYSFLIDYFVNVDDMIDSWSFHTVDMAWYSRNIRKRKLLELAEVYWDGPQKVRDYNDHLGPKTIIECSLSPPYWIWETKNVLRSTQAALGPLTGEWQFGLPGARQSLNMLALIRQFKQLRFFR